MGCCSQRLALSCPELWLLHQHVGRYTARLSALLWQKGPIRMGLLSPRYGSAISVGDATGACSSNRTPRAHLFHMMVVAGARVCRWVRLAGVAEGHRSRSGASGLPVNAPVLIMARVFRITACRSAHSYGLLSTSGFSGNHFPVLRMTTQPDGGPRSRYALCRKWLRRMPGASARRLEAAAALGGTEENNRPIAVEVRTGRRHRLNPAAGAALERVVKSWRSSEYQPSPRPFIAA